MAKNLVVIHATKYSNSAISSGALGKHIDRKCISKNVDQERTKLNMSINRGKLNLKQAIDKRIGEGYKGKKKIRESAVKSIGFILSGSHEQMKTIEKEGKIKEWAIESTKFIAQEFGYENIVRAEVHMDEHTPHMHVHVVPITPDGRLSAKELLDRKKLKRLQEEYPKVMKKYGLKRGISGSKRKHVTTEQFYKMEEKAEQWAEELIQDKDIKKITQLIYATIPEEKKYEYKKRQTDTRKKNQYANPIIENKKKLVKKDEEPPKHKGKGLKH